MDYEKKYNNIVNTLQSLIANSKKQGHIIILIEDIENAIPELKENEEERIRKALIALLKFGLEDGSAIAPGFKETKEEALAWLEKQGEQVKPRFRVGDKVYEVIDGIECIIESIDESTYYGDTTNFDIKDQDYWELVEKPLEKVEPKFHVGDWIAHNLANFAFKIISVGRCGYEVVNRENYKKTLSFECADENFHLWTIQDAKDGDVLLFEGYYNSIVLFQGIGINGQGRINYHCKCDLGNYSFGVQGDVACLGTIDKDAENYHPATKEQRDILFSKMREAGYEWDNEKKELKIIDLSKHIKYEPDSPSINEQKTAELCEEDERIRKDIIAIFKGKIPYTSVEDAKRYIAWLEKQGDKESKDEIIPDKNIEQNPADEDERIRKDMIFYFTEEIHQCSIQEHADIMRKFIWWLEKQGESKTELIDEDEIYWLAWAIGRLPDTEQANEAEAVLRGLLGKLEHMKGGEQ